MQTSPPKVVGVGAPHQNCGIWFCPPDNPCGREHHHQFPHFCYAEKMKRVVLAFPACILVGKVTPLGFFREQPSCRKKASRIFPASKKLGKKSSFGGF